MLWPNLLKATPLAVSYQSTQVILADDMYPYAYHTEQGLPAGLLVDYWQELALVGDFKLDIKIVPRTQISVLSSENKFQVIGGLTRNAERERKFLLGESFIDIYTNVFIHRDLPQLSRLEQLQPLVIGVLAHSSHIPALKEKIPDVVIREYETSDELYDAALNGEIRAFTGLDRLTPRYHDAKRLVEAFPLYKKLPLQKIDFTYAVRQDLPELAAKITKARANLPANLMDKLQRRWLSGVSNEQTLLIALSVGNPPLMNVSLSGEPQGLLVDLWQLWSDVTGTPIAFIPDSSMAGLKALQLGRIDLHMGFPVNAAIPEQTMSAYESYKIQSSFYYPKHTPINDLSDATLPIGLFKISSYDSALREKAPLKEILRFARLEDMLQALDRRQISGFFAADLIMQERVLKEQQSEFSKLEHPTFSSALHVLVQQGNQRLADKIQQGFEMISQDQLEAIEKKWISDPSQRYFQQFRLQVPFSAEQQKWLSQHNELRIGIMANWAPIEFVDEQGSPQGVTYELLKLVQERTGIRFKFVPYEEWSDMYEDFKGGQLDLAMHLAQTPERKAFAEFTHDFWPLRWTLASSGDISAITSLKQLAGKKVAVKKEYQIIHFLQKNFPEILVVPVKNQQQAIEYIHNGDAEFLIDSFFAIGNMLRQREYANFRMHLPDDMPTYPTTLAVRHPSKELMAILNKGFRTLSNEDRQQITDRWLVQQPNVQSSSDRRYTTVVQVILAITLLVVLVIFWNLSLRREVGLRRTMEEQMRFMASHDDLTKLANRNLLQERLTQAIYQHARHQEKLALMFIDLDGFKAVNDQFGHHVGDELLVHVAEILTRCVRKSDTVARFGGDEFVILLTGLVDRDDAAIVAEKILHQLSFPIGLSTCQAQINASIGIALYPDDGTDESQMLKIADGLMYLAKDAGKGRYRFRSQ